MLTKSITVRIPLKQLNEELVKKLDILCKEHKGEHKFKMKVVDAENEISLDLISKSNKVNASSQFVRLVEGMGLPYRLN